MKRLTHAVARRLGLPRSHTVGGVPLRLPAGHPLPEYQAAHPRYDRFLTHLAARLMPGDAVIDVGANVGDSVAALLAGQGALQVLAVEGDAGFFAQLEVNATRLAAAYPAAHIASRQALVGSAGQSLTLVQREPGTRHAVAGGAGAAATVPLAELAEAQGAPFVERLRLVKSDVDGWDHDVLASALPLLAARRPLVFAECMVASVAERDAWLALVQRLFDAGYAQLQLFDNLGNPLGAAADASLLAAALDTTLAPNRGNTMPYVDLLLTSATDQALAEQAVAAHVRAHPASTR